ncbi:hypothetical protein B7494_g6665 [Chlorociboria aeruginascens]|nr:hypothetical protein B7494_g6665 [Chlorociboria aeruginascens]
MPTQRPFFANFLAAFRAHSAIQQQQSKTPSTTTSNTNTTTSTPSNPRSITASKPGATTSALTSLHSPRTHSTSPLSRSPNANEGATSSGNMNMGTGASNGRYLRGRTRRESDSSSEGFRDVLGAEKWYIGGRTQGGEERYFKLGVVRRQRSGDRLSLDRLSL